MDLLLNWSIVPRYSFTWDYFINTLEILLCSSPVLIDQIGVYLSALKVELFNTKVMQHPFSYCHGSCPKLAAPWLLCCCFAVLWQLCGWGEVAAAVGGTGFTEFPSSHNSFCSRGFTLWEFSVIVTENEAYKGMWFEKLKFSKFAVRYWWSFISWRTFSNGFMLHIIP